MSGTNNLPVGIDASAGFADLDRQVRQLGQTFAAQVAPVSALNSLFGVTSARLVDARQSAAGLGESLGQVRDSLRQAGLIGSGGPLGEIGGAFGRSVEAVKGLGDAARNGASGFALLNPALLAATAAASTALLVWQNWDSIVGTVGGGLRSLGEGLGLLTRTFEMSNAGIEAATRWHDAYAAALRKARGEVDDLAQAELTRLQASNFVARQTLVGEQWRAEGALRDPLRQLEAAEVARANLLREPDSPQRRALLGLRNSEVANAEAEVTRLRGEIDRRGAEVRRLQDDYVSLSIGGAAQFRPETYRTPSANDGGGGGGAEGPDATSRMVQQNYWAEQARQQREAEKAREDAARDEERALERRAQANARTTDDIVRYGAERFADLFSSNEGGWKRMLANFRQTAIATFARISAEAVLRPLVAPVVSALGLGGFGESTARGGGGLGGGGLGGLSNLLGLGSAANSLSGGGLLNSLGLSGIGSTVGGWLSTPLWGGGALAGPGGLAALEASGGAGLGMLGPSIGSLLGPAALGAAGGGLVASLTGGNPIGGSVGGALGAVAGSLILPGIGTILGAAAGGGLGGLFGNSGQAFSGGDALVGRTDDGLLTVSGFAGKGYDGGQLTEQTRQQVAQLNARLTGAGLRATSGMRANVGGGESPNPTSLSGALDKFGFGYTAADSRIQTAINLRGPQGVEATLAVAEQAQALITALGTIQAPVSDFGQRLAAINAQFGPLTQAARDLGFGLDQATTAQQRALDDLWASRVEAFAGIKTGLSIREARARGDNTGAALMEFDYGATNAVTALEAQLKALEITADDSAEAIGRLRTVQDQERAALQRANASGAQQLLESLTFGGDSLLSPAARGQAALSAFNTARSGVGGGQGLDEFLRVAGTALPVLRDYLGPSERFAGVLSATASTLSGVPGADPAQLARLLEAQAYGQDRVAEAVFAAGYDTVAAIEALRGEFRDYAGRVDAVLRRYVAA